PAGSSTALTESGPASSAAERAVMSFALVTTVCREEGRRTTVSPASARTPETVTLTSIEGITPEAFGLAGARVMLNRPGAPVADASASEDAPVAHRRLPAARDARNVSRRMIPPRFFAYAPAAV